VQGLLGHRLRSQWDASYDRRAYLVPKQIPAECELRDVISTLAMGLCELR